MKIGQAIKDVRLAQNPKVSQLDLCEKMGITQSYLSLIECGKKQPSADIIASAANALNVPLPILFMNAIEESDVPEEKREIFKALYPSMKTLSLSIFNN